MVVSLLPGKLVNAHLRARFAFGANPSSNPSGWTWTDVTADVMQADNRMINITVGRTDQASTASPAVCMFTLDNRTAAYTMYSGQSQYYPNVRENTPLWVEVDPGDGTYRTRFFGFANTFKPGWDTTGNFAIADVTANGSTRRYNQGKSPLRSCLYRGITIDGVLPTAGAKLLAYWPLEDGSLATTAASAVLGVPPLVVSSAPTGSGIVKFGQSGDAPPGSDQVADLSSGGVISIGIPAGLPIKDYFIAFAVKYPAGITLGDTIPVMRLMFPGVIAGEWTYMDLVGRNDADTSGGIGWQGYLNGSGTLEGAGQGAAVDGTWHWFGFSPTASGSNAGADMYVDGQDAGTITIPATLGALQSIIINPLGVVSDLLPCLGHLMIWDKVPPTAHDPIYDYYAGKVGETPAARMTRLASEQGEAFTVIDASYSAVALMGPQGIDTYLNLMRECEAADAGYLYDGFAQGLQYRGLRDRMNQTAALTLDASAGEIQPPFAPISDDTGRVNDMTATRTNGGTFEYVDKTSDLGTNAVGTYDSSLTINVQSDGYLVDRAGWEVSKGTQKGYRYPAKSLDFSRTPSKAVAWSDTGLGDIVAVKLPYATQLPTDTVRLAVEGYTEQLTNLRWIVTPLNLSVAALLDAAVYGTSASVGVDRYDSGSSSVNTGFNTTAASISVKTADPVDLWTTVAAEFPFDVDVGGEQMTVSNITGSSSPQTFTISARHVNGVTKSHSVNEVVRLYKPSTYGI